MRTEEEVADWQQKLEATFSGPSGIHGERLLDLENHEAEHKALAVSTLQGFVRLMDAFFDFSIQTFREAFKNPDELDPVDVSAFVANLWRFRTSYNIFWDGYYFDATSHLRGVYENILHYGALHNGYISRAQLWIRPIPEESPKDFERRSLREGIEVERIVRSHMVGSESGFDDDTQEKFRIFFGMLHKHVHRSRTTAVFLLGDAISDEKGISIMPRFDLEKAHHYGTVVGFLAWCFTRLLRTLLKNDLHSEEWRKRLHVLDESFNFTIIGKPFSDGIQRFMAEKYKFAVL